MNTTVKRKAVCNDGVNIYYEVYRAGNAGNGSIAADASANARRPVLFFVHGVGGDLDAWQFIKNALLEKGFSSIAMDLRGHGKSDHPRSRAKYHLDYFIKDVMTVIEAEKLDKVILVGHSLGAVLTTHIALRHQEKIERLILISSSYLPPAYFKLPGMFLLSDILTAVSPPPFHAGHSIYPPEKHHDDIEILGLIKTIARNSLMSYLLSSKEILKSNIAAYLPDIKIPTLIISGDKDTVFPTPISEYIHSKIPRSELKIIPGGNHVLILNNIDEVTRCITDFIH
jgi:pimeloyl-ACP methyl ester carboxylesterase